MGKPIGNPRRLKLQSSSGVSDSSRTVRRELKNPGFDGRAAQHHSPGAKLTAIGPWTTFSWSDEWTLLRLADASEVTVKCLGGTNMVWGYFSGFGLVTGVGNRNSEMCVDILPTLWPYFREGPFLFLQETRGAMVRRNGCSKPFQSPDLYPTEHLWDGRERRLTAQSTLLAARTPFSCDGHPEVHSYGHLSKTGAVLSSSCLQIHPFWMQQNSKYLYNLSLSEIMIPGSHDSGSFYFHRERAPLSKYKYAQEETIFNQLVYGLRYFDLRVGYYKKTKDKYYINHNFLRTQHSVRSVLHQVHEFINATKEIVILDFHRFPKGFETDAIHKKLMDFITSTFESYLIPYKDSYANATFRTLWEENKRVLVSYDSKVRDTYFSQFLWPSIYRAWGNKQKPKDLKQYFEEVFRRPTPNGLWASMAELTPNARTIVLHPETGLRVFAEEINRNVTHWFRDLYWHKANIVATDYFMGNDIINVAIETNVIKGTCPKDTWK